MKAQSEECLIGYKADHRSVLTPGTFLSSRFAHENISMAFLFFSMAIRFLLLIQEVTLSVSSERNMY